MSFREKSAYVMLVAVLVVAVWLVSEVYDPSNTETWLSYTREPLIIGALVILAVVSAIGHAVIAARNPEEANEPLDEREREIVSVAQGFAYNTLIIGVLASFAMLHIDGSLRLFAVLVSFSMLISWFVQYSSQIVLFRRGGV